MDKDINLLLKKQVDFQKQGDTVRKLRIVAVIFVAVLGISSVVIFFLSQQFSPSPVRKEEKAVLYNISFLHPREAKLALVKERAANIESILSQRPDYNLTIGAILEKAPGGVTVQSLSVDKEAVSLSGVSNSLLPIDGFINSLVDMAKKRHIIKDVTIDSIILDGKSGVYSLSLKINLI